MNGRPRLCDIQHAMLGRGGADDVRMGFGVRHRTKRGQPQIEESAAMFECLAFPGLEHDRFGFFEPRLRFGVIDTETLIIINIVSGAAAKSDDQAAFGQVIDKRDLFRHPDRMMQRHLRHSETDFRMMRRGRQRGGETDRIDIGADAVEMMLRQPDDVEAQFVGQFRLTQGFVDHARVIGRGRGLREQEVGNAHRRAFRRGLQYARAGAVRRGAEDGNSTTAVPSTDNSSSWFRAACSISTRWRPSSSNLRMIRAEMNSMSPSGLWRRILLVARRRKPSSPIQFVI